MPGQEGEAWEKPSSSSSLHSNGNYLHILHDNVAQIMREQDSRKRLQSHREESPHSMIGRHSQGVTAQNREKAGGRDFQSDRVESMRRQDWKSHKETCTGNQKYICLLIHPLMSSSGPESRDMLMDYIPKESTTTTSPGILLIERNREKAGGRDFQSDRVESMRRHDWKSHKETCTGNQKYICLLIHPLTSSSGPESRDMRMDCMEPFHLKSYGNWGAEMRELRERLGWAKADYPPTLTLPPWLRLSTTGKEANMMRLLAGSVPPHPFPPELETRCQ
ncbi:hypothetical protein V8E54_014978, partial [Elaphomyces granulatus]